MLGKGLEALIPRTLSIEVEERNLVYLPIETITPSAYQPRFEIGQKELEELARSIKEQGVIQPIVVRKVKDKYEVVAGQRRYQACKSLGFKELPSIIRELNDQEAFLFALIENIQRKDLNPIEEAQAFQRLNEKFGLTYEDIARLVGKDKTSVANSLRLLKLPQEIQDALKKELITKTQARTILGLDSPQKQKELFYKILKEGLTVREIEERVRKRTKRKKTESPFVIDMEERIKKYLGTRVDIMNKKNNSGKIVITYYNLNDLERITKKMAV